MPCELAAPGLYFALGSGGSLLVPYPLCDRGDDLRFLVLLFQ